ncbi:DUF2066 domain-containing protein [Piscirickettsia litoralis]|uniref:DUF2066 domain-containing protein n=1 Tax=Piscirickettsia litoralis TaxID=1891921 RepID=A0ABX3A3R9_9GAMM|nr:DUF2066 domain-containing protein [Piscirickettsia litoralis]ODN43504.1 hypothetical protein BGC07_11975 [Piscirickettsia litoralis]
MRRLLHFLLLITSLYLLNTSLSFAVFLPHLFQANIPIDQNTQSERDLALGTALFSTLNKITTQNLSSEQKKQLQQSPWRFVSSYTIKKIPQPAKPTEAIHSNEPNQTIQPQAITEPDSLVFHVQLNEQRLKAWLKKNKIQFWDNYRPITLVWLVIDNDMQKLIVGDNDQLTTSVLNKAAEKYGIPLQFPKVDVRDLKQISADEIWNFNIPALKKASQRYRPDTILAGRVFPTATGWETHWQLITKNKQTLSWSSASEHLSSVLKTATGHLAHNLAQLYQSSEEEHQFTIQVLGIDHLQQYRNLTTYLAKQHVISQVQTKVISADTVTLDLTSNVNQKQLLKILALSRKLSTIETQTAPDGALKFRWQG